MKYTEPEGGVGSASAAVRGASRCLLCPTPEAMARAESLLGEAQAWLRSAVDSAQPPHPGHSRRLRASLEDVRKSLDRVRGLNEYIASYFAGWVRLRNTLAAGYTAEGQPAGVVCGSRLSLEG